MDDELTVDDTKEVRKSVAMFDSYLMCFMKMSEELNITIDIGTILTLTGKVIGWMTVGDYERRVMTNGYVQWNYRPKVLKGDSYDVSLYQDDVDPARIVSFTMPPKELAEDGSETEHIDSLAQAECDNSKYEPTMMLDERHGTALHADRSMQGECNA